MGTNAKKLYTKEIMNPTNIVAKKMDFSPRSFFLIHNTQIKTSNRITIATPVNAQIIMTVGIEYRWCPGMQYTSMVTLVTLELMMPSDTAKAKVSKDKPHSPGFGK